MFGYCSLQATVRPSCSTTLCTCPSEAAAAGSRGNSAKRAAQSGPSSATIRRRTNGLLIGGALLCSWASSAAYSAGSASGMVAISCATFINGPLRPPRASLSSAALPAVEPPAHHPGTRDPRRLHADGAPHLRIAAHTRAEAVLAFDLAGGRVRLAHAGSGIVASSWSISPSSRRRPLAQKPGSEASSPNGASSSLCRRVPPASQQLEIARLEAVGRFLVDRVERADEAVTESIGIDVERHMDEVWNIGPVKPIVFPEMERRPEALGLHLHPQPAQIVRRQLRLAPGVVHPSLELAERDLAHHRVDLVLDLGREQHTPPHRVGLLREQRLEGQLLAEHRGGLGQGQRRARHQRPLPGRQHLVDAVAQLVRQGHDVPAAALVVHQHVGMRAGHGGMAEGAAVLAGTQLGVDPGALEEPARRCRPGSARSVR